MHESRKAARIGIVKAFWRPFRLIAHRLILDTDEVVAPLLNAEDLVLRLQDACGVADALGAPLAYRPQGQDLLNVERVQLVGVRQGFEQLARPLASLPASLTASISSMRSNFSL